MENFVDWLYEHPSAIRIIVGLLRLRGKVFSKSFAAGYAGVSRSTYFELFPKLVEFKVIEPVESGGRSLFRLNERHPLVHALLELSGEG